MTRASGFPGADFQEEGTQRTASLLESREAYNESVLFFRNSFNRVQAAILWVSICPKN
jgi:hypothetical protein